MTDKKESALDEFDRFKNTVDADHAERTGEHIEVLKRSVSRLSRLKETIEKPADTETSGHEFIN